MPYLLFGDDTYRSQLKLNAIKAKYIDKNLGDTNLAVLDGEAAKGDDVIRQFWAMPFLAPKRLVIVRNLLLKGSKECQEAVLAFLPKMPSTTVAVFHEQGTPDKRTSLFKALNRPSQSEEFPYLDEVSLRRWVTQNIKNASIDPPALNLLVKTVGPDLWRMTQEIDKLTNYADGNIALEAVNELIHHDISGDTFQLIDCLIERNLPAAFRHLRGRLALGDSPLALLGMFAYGFRTLLIVQDLLSRNPRCTSAPGIHPYVWRKAASQVKRFSPQSLRHSYRTLRDVDYASKTGIMEPSVALEFFVLEFCTGCSKEGTNGSMAAI